MSPVELRAQLLNDGKAERLIESVSDPILANLLRYALAQARLHLLPPAGVDPKEWEKSLPESPFDLEFFARVVHGMFSKRHIIEKLLSGATPAEATGWDVFE
jgi:hypothetical protein